MGYLIRLEPLPRFLRENLPGKDYFTSNFPDELGRPKAAFPHLCFVFGPGDALTHVGVVMRKGESNSDFSHKLNVKHVKSIDKPVPRADLFGKLHGKHRDSVEKCLKAGDGVLTDAADKNLVVALTVLRPDFEESLRWLLNLHNRRVESPSADRWNLARDALRVGLRIGGFSTERLDEWYPPSDVDAPVVAGIKPRDYEADLLDHDSRAFPGWQPQLTSRVGVRVFADGERRMEVTNINASPQEANLGADLLYYHRHSRSLIFVQYKRLEDGKEVRVDDSLRDQIDRMDLLQAVRREPSHHRDWRLGPDYCFLKLCNTSTDSGVIDPINMELLKGLYLPLSFLRLLLEDERLLGPRNGTYLGYERVERHISNTIFLTLAQEGWIGSTGVTPEEVGVIANRSVAERRELLLMNDRSQEAAKDRQRRTRNHQKPRDSGLTEADQMQLFE